MNEPLLSIKNLCVSASGSEGDAAILKNVSLSVSRGESVALVGRSGAGKSTVASSILRLLPSALHYDKGSIFFEGEDLLRISEMRLRSIRGRKVVFIPQNPSAALSPVQSIASQCIQLIRLHFPMSRKEAEFKVLDAITHVGLDDAARVGRAHTRELSGGMCQRVLLAMAFLYKPLLILSDEPTASLDSTASAAIFELLNDLCRKQHTSHLLITHDMDHAVKSTQRIVVLDNGSVIETISPEADTAQHPASKALMTARLLLREKTKWQEARMNSSAPLLSVEKATISFPLLSPLLRRKIGEITPVADLSFSISKGEMVALVGASGSGKTTLARALVGLTPVKSGQILYKGISIDRLLREDEKQYRRKIQLLFQDFGSAFNPRLCMEDSISEGLLIHSIVKTREEARENVHALLRDVDLDSSILERYPHECSGGERQRMLLVRALALDPEMLICDEPTSALDSINAIEIMELIRRLIATKHLSVLLISHDQKVVSYFADSVVYLSPVASRAAMEHVSAGK